MSSKHVHLHLLTYNMSYKIIGRGMGKAMRLDGEKEWGSGKAKERKQRRREEEKGRI